MAVALLAGQPTAFYSHSFIPPSCQVSNIQSDRQSVWVLPCNSSLGSSYLHLKSESLMRNIKEVRIKKILIMYYLRWDRSPHVIELMNSE